MEELFSAERLALLTRRLMTFGTHERVGLDQAMRYVRGWLRRSGVMVHGVELPSGSVLIADSGSPIEVLIVAHIDVVPPRDARQSVPRQEGDRIIGRGGYDMLGGLAAVMEVMWARARDAAGGPGVRLLVVPDEETTLATIREYVELYGQSADGLGRFVITPEPTDGQIALGAKGRLLCRITCTGLAAHDSRAWEGKNAILAMAAALGGIELLPFIGEQSAVFPEGPTVQPTQIAGGAATNVVPDRCECHISIRYLPSQRPEDIVGQLRTLPQIATVEPVQVLRALNVPETNPHVRLLEAVVSPRLEGSKFRHQRGTSVLAVFPPQGPDGVEWGPRGGSQHAPDEWVSESSLVEYAQALSRFFDALPHGGERAVVRDS